MALLTPSCPTFNVKDRPSLDGKDRQSCDNCDQLSRDRESASTALCCALSAQERQLPRDAYVCVCVCAKVHPFATAGQQPVRIISHIWHFVYKSNEILINITYRFYLILYL